MGIIASYESINCHLSHVNVSLVSRWGQVFILDSISNYTPKDDREAQSICERVTPRLAHANAAVVLSAVKVGGLVPLMWYQDKHVVNCSNLSELCFN